MIKKPNWSQAMWTAIEARAATPFAWGSNDCCLFVAHVVDAMTNGRFVQQLSQRYTDHASALRYIASEGGIGPAVSEYLGQASRIRPQRGDVVLWAGDKGETLGLCVGAELAAMGPDGVVFVPKSLTLETWTI